MGIYRQPAHRRLAPLASHVFVAWAVAWAGCGQAPQTPACNPPCDTGTHCVDNACVPDHPQADFSVVSVDMSACPSGCSGMTPYCNANGVCVPCVQDSQCPIGKYCKPVGQGNECAPGCNDDSRCGGGAMKCCGGVCTDTSKDAGNCGACGTACMAPNGGGACMDGKCTAGACSPGWGDCNHDPADGCETNLHVDVNNCNGCGMTCTMPNGISACSDGCYLAACNWGYEDCDSDPSNGCEINIATDPKNCGQCGKACTPVARAQVGCSFDGCNILACSGGYADCNHTYNDGCETSIGNDVKNCGKCGNACNQGQVCINGECTCPVCMLPNAKAGCFGNQCGVASCNPGWADCNGIAMDGCEQNIDSDANNCGACGNKCGNNLVCVQQSCTCPQCKIPNAKSVCVNNVCILDSCLPGFANCDGQAANGCEVDLNSDPNNCSKCGLSCGANMACALGTCTTCGANLIDNGGILCVPAGMSYAVSGDLCYTSQVVINGTLTVKAFDGNAGGKLVLRSPSILISGTGKILGDAAGNLGGKPAAAQGGMQGGGTGGGCGGGPGSSVGQGGSGGGYGGTGGTCKQPTQWTSPCDKCSQATIAHCYGAVGAIQGTKDGIDYDLGNGGGAGGNSAGCGNAGGRGGAGGAAIVLMAKAIQIDGAVSAAGEAPPQDASNCGYHPGGGGGSGGIVVVRAATLSGKGSLAAPGGAGGFSPGSGGDWGWAGGGGGGGRVKVFATTDQFMGTLDASLGQGGGACGGGFCYAGMPGTAGTTNRSNSIPNAWNLINCGGL